ncbi:MAG TPA: lasso RiPP family leader peptide-containing protein [Terriglobia bacterium]|nr:lasso RiPP family leader peptide-containing protein [Terriglobia bacterium]
MQQDTSTTRQPYVKPELTEFGAIEKLTQGASSSVGDGVHVSRK